MTRDGSLRVHTSGGVIGDVISGDCVSLNFAAAWPLINRGWVRLLFSHLADTEEIFTGIAIDNPSPEPAEIELSLFSSGGILTDSTEISILGWARLSRLISELLPEAADQRGGYLILSSSQPIFAQQVFGDRKLSFLSVAPPGRTTRPFVDLEIAND